MSLETLGALLVSLSAAVALAAVAGLRAFLPLLALSIGSRAGLLELHQKVDFLGSDVALVALIAATILETAADKIPILDHSLDAVGAFVRPGVGFLAGMAVLGDLPEPLTVALSLVLALLTLGTHLERAKVRVGSTVTTAGVGNPVLSVMEDVLAATLSILAVLAPVLAAILIFGVVYLLWRFWGRILRHWGLQRT